MLNLNKYEIKNGKKIIEKMLSKKCINNKFTDKYISALEKQVRVFLCMYIHTYTKLPTYIHTCMSRG